MFKKYLYYIVLILSCYSVSSYSEDIYSQRKLFWKARDFLLTKHYKQFEQLKIHLINYPLYPYLAYIKLKQQLTYQNTNEIDNFLEIYHDTPLAHRLRAQCLIKYAKNKAWKYFLHYYRADKDNYGPTFQCYYFNALLATHQERKAYHAIPSLWLTLRSPSIICKKVFSRWESARGLNHKLIWKKLQQAMQDNNLVTIEHLAQFLTRKDKQQLKFWFKVNNQPLLVEQTERFDETDNTDRTIILHGIQRLAIRYPNKLAEIWPLLTKMYAFSEVERQKLLSMLAVSLARQADLDADSWLEQIKPRYSNTIVREWRVRNQLLKGDWKKVLYWIDHLSFSEKKLPCWRYWRARALAENNQAEAANKLYHNLAQEVDYYGVLASQRLHQTYRPKTQRSRGDYLALKQNLGIKRAKELYTLGFNGDARREWQWALPSLSKLQLQAAAQLATKWQWYDLAIIAAAKAQIYNDIKLRFPKAYQSSVLSIARKTHLNSAWIWAIMRQESAFMWNAKSSAGAIGLMQIMPTTGTNLAKQLKLNKINLLDSELNIQLGSIYLNQLLKMFHGSAVLATAAYNVGPARVKNYQALYHQLPQDVWVEILPWKETRDYIKGVSLARNIYSQL